MRIWMWYGGAPGQEFGDDKGAQWIMADPVDVPATLTLPAALEVSEFTKARTYFFGFVDDEIVLDLGRTVVRYEVTVRNLSSWAVRFTVQGGGNT